MIDKDYCKGCKWLRSERKGDERIYSCFIARVALPLLRCCPMKNDNCYK